MLKRNSSNHGIPSGKPNDDIDPAYVPALCELCFTMLERDEIGGTESDIVSL